MCTNTAQNLCFPASFSAKTALSERNGCDEGVSSVLQGWGARGVLPFPGRPRPRRARPALRPSRLPFPAGERGGKTLRRGRKNVRGENIFPPRTKFIFSAERGTKHCGRFWRPLPPRPTGWRTDVSPSPGTSRPSLRARPPSPYYIYRRASRVALARKMPIFAEASRRPEERARRPIVGQGKETGARKDGSSR